MSGANVKITILQRLLRGIAPDLCYFCGKVGAVFCPHCKYDITYDVPSICFKCDLPAKSGVCMRHSVYITQVRSAGVYADGLKNAIKGLKFQRDAFCVRALGELLNEATPELPLDTVVVPVPTRRAAVRQRGYDHVLVLARQLARQRGLRVYTNMRRSGGTVQHDLKTRKDREDQISGVFTIPHPPASPPSTALIVDDVITTGATLQEVARTLRSAGVETIYAVAVARTP